MSPGRRCFHWSCLSRLDHGSATLVGLPAYQIDRLQSLLNAAARLVYSSQRYNYVTPLLRELHWLRMSQRIDYKVQTGSSRLPLTQRPSSVVPRQRSPACGGPRRPAASSLGINEHTRRACDVPVNCRGDRAFPVAAARVWNSLLADVTSSPSLPTFQRRLKIKLFARSNS